LLQRREVDWLVAIQGATPWRQRIFQARGAVEQYRPYAAALATAEADRFEFGKRLPNAAAILTTGIQLCSGQVL
jgi:hypothetical protein